MRDRAAEQAAPTMHQSLIRNNSTADSWHEIVPLLKRAIPPPDSGPGLCARTHAHLRARMRVDCMCVSEPAAVVCYPLTSQGEDGLLRVSTVLAVVEGSEGVAVETEGEKKNPALMFLKRL